MSVQHNIARMNVFTACSSLADVTSVDLGASPGDPFQSSGSLRSVPGAIAWDTHAPYNATMEMTLLEWALRK
ncbi:MAG: hypothetical protein WCA14_00255 [Steroidobacteraceae bacterium]